MMNGDFLRAFNPIYGKEALIYCVLQEYLGVPELINWLFCLCIERRMKKILAKCNRRTKIGDDRVYIQPLRCTDQIWDVFTWIRLPDTPDGQLFISTYTCYCLNKEQEERKRNMLVELRNDLFSRETLILFMCVYLLYHFDLLRSLTY